MLQKIVKIENDIIIRKLQYLWILGQLGNVWNVSILLLHLAHGVICEGRTGWRKQSRKDMKDKTID